jgi:PAS domain S-box-containing protein
MRIVGGILKLLGRLRLWQQFVILGLFIIVVPITSTSLRFLNEGRDILTAHEIIDLSDESNLRANEIREEFDYLVRDVAREARGLNGKPLDRFDEDAEKALQRFTQQRPLEMPDPGQPPATAAQVRRRFYADTLVESHAVAIARGEAGGPVTGVTAVRTVDLKGRTLPADAPADPVAWRAIRDVCERLCREYPRSPSYVSGFQLAPGSSERGAQCLVAVAWPARWADSHVTHALVAVINFTRVVENRRGISPRHLYLLAQPDGTLLVHPDPKLPGNGVKVFDVIDWKFPDRYAWVRPGESAAEREARLAKMVQEGGTRLDGVAVPRLAGYYRKGFFDRPLADALGDNAVAELQTINRVLALEALGDPSLRYGEFLASARYCELSHPDRARLVQICARIEAWWAGAKHPGRPRIDWIAPLYCENYQGQLTYLRMDANDEDEPPRLLVAAALEELHEDVDTQFSRIVKQWVIPTVLIAVFLAVGLIFAITRSLRTLADTADTLRDPDAPPTLEAGGSREVTQLAASFQGLARRLQDDAARMQSVLRTAGEGILIAGPDGRVEEANRSAALMFGHAAPEDLVGRPLAELLVEQPAGLSPLGLIPLAVGAPGAGPSVMRITDAVRARRADGSAFWAEYTLRPVPLRDRTVFAGVFRDVTQKKAAEEEITRMNEDLESRVRVRTAELAEANTKLEVAFRQAEAASRAKDAFVANMSHELRQPLHIIIGFTEAMKDEAGDIGADARDSLIPDLNKILSAAKHLLDLINDILDLAKIAAGRMELNVAPFDLPGMVADVQSLVGPLAEKNRNRFVVDAPAALGTMASDERRVRQVLINLLSNAFKFTADGTVTLQVRRITSAGREIVEFSVADTGKGMNPDQVARLFQRFYQADASTTREQGGTGLGLAITQSFNELLGGEPILVSSVQGSGSHFVVRLPAVAEPPGERKLPTRATPPELTATTVLPAVANGTPGATILVIDDDPMVPELMARFLGKDGFHVLGCADGEEGFRLARERRPAAITLDVMMPGTDGWGVLAKLKADPATCDIPVVMLTIVDDRGRGFALGAADYLTKPIDWPRLNTLLKRYQGAGHDAPILVIDDDPECREMVRRFLERDGRQVVEAPDGEAGLRMIAVRYPSLILLDLMMPVLDGFGFLAELPKRFPGARVPVVVLTAKDLTPDDHARLNGRVARILEKGDLTQFEPIAELVRTLTPHAPTGTGG